MSSKFKKLLLSIIIALIGILGTSNVNAKVTEGKVFQNEVSDYITGHRFSPTEEGDGILFCIEPGAKFKASLSRTDFNAYSNITWTPSQGGVLESQLPSAPWSGTRSYLQYKQVSKSYDKNEIGYIFATAQENNITIPKNMFMARTIWASSLSDPSQGSGTWLNKAAKAYVEWREQNINEKGELKTASFEIYENDKKAKVAVDQGEKEYTVGRFNVKYGKGETTHGSTKEDKDINLNTLITNLSKAYDEAETKIVGNQKYIKQSGRENGDKWANFISAYEKARTELDKKVTGATITIEELADEEKVKEMEGLLTEDQFEEIYKNIASALNNLMSKEKVLVNKVNDKTIEKAKGVVVEYKDDDGKTKTKTESIKFYSEIDTTIEKAVEGGQDEKQLFCYVSELKIEGYSDVQGKGDVIETLKNDVNAHQFKIVNENGGEITGTPVMKNNNTTIGTADYLPNNNQPFYIKFKLNNDKVKSIRVSVKITYLSGCEATVEAFVGNEQSWSWSKKNGTTASSTTYTCPIAHDGDHVSTCIATTEDYKTWEKKDADTGEIQELGWIKKLDGIGAYGKKIWKDLPLTTPTKGGIDITMDIGGYAFIDMKDDVKGNDNNGIREDNEGLKDVEVWLYKHGDDNKVEKIASTNEKGYYQFSELDAMKNYYVRFVYNGMIYETIPEYNINENYNTDAWKVTSKAQEVENGKFDERTPFNNIFAEIGSYPDNYSIVGHQMFGSDLGNYNRTYTQMEIADTFKQLSSKIEEKYKNTEYVNKSYTDVVKEVCHELAGNDTEAKRKLQFAADCRISAYSTRNKAKINDTYGGDNPTKDIYPVYSKFVLDGKGVDTEDGKIFTLGNETYKPIYNGQYYINCGVEPRQAFKLALRKDAYNAKVSINGKTETYWYNFLFSKDPFTITITRENYEKAMNDFYLTGNKNQQVFDTEKYDRNNIKTEYNLYTRKEEVYNGDGNVDNYNALGGSVDSATRLENGYKINNSYEEDLEKLKQTLDIRVTYKIEVSNQSKVLGQVTEVVDYFDRNYEMVEAYAEHTKDGVTMDRLPVDINTQSMYATRGNNQFIDASKYDTRYLTIPETEGKRLLGDNGKIYYYVTLRLRDPEKNTPNAALLKAYMNSGEKKLRLINLAEINGYKTYLEDRTLPAGLVDIDSNPGNLDLRGRAFNEASLDSTPHIGEDDTSRAPTIVCDKTESRTLEGQVFEDVTNASLNTGDIRNGDGTLTTNDKGINGVIVELVELTNEGMKVRSTTTTTQIQRDGQTIDGWYGFIDFLPGNYTIRFTYGSNNDTAMKNDSYYASGRNDKSYNGQDFQSTIYSLGNGNKENKIDTDLVNRLNELYNSKNNQETSVTLSGKELIDNHKDGNYWYEKDVDIRSSDARDDEARKQEVINYSRKEYQKDGKDTEIVSHKAEVFNAYETINNLPVHTKNNGELEGLVKELERRTFRYAYTPEMNIEVEYATNEIGDAAQRNSTEQYKHQIRNVDFGVVERPRSELVIDQDVAHIKVTAADGVTVLFDTDTATNNLQWIKGNTKNAKDYFGKDINDYDKNELLNIIMDEELIDGATLEVTYNIKVTNNGETDYDVNGQVVTTRAKNIINYVSNNLTFDEKENPDWEVVKLSDIQNDKNSTWIHQTFSIKTGYADEDTFLDLSNQQVILKAKEGSPLTKALQPNASTDIVQLKLKKKMSTEGANDNLTYTNMSEIVEIENTVGRYDHGATPGNQDINYEPQEHDTSGASYYDRQENYPDTNKPYGNTPQDGRIIVTPPTGSTHIYYWIGIVGTLLLAVGIYLIKKFVLDNRK